MLMQPPRSNAARRTAGHAAQIDHGERGIRNWSPNLLRRQLVDTVTRSGLSGSNLATCRVVILTAMMPEEIADPETTCVSSNCRSDYPYSIYDKRYDYSGPS